MKLAIACLLAALVAALLGPSPGETASPPLPLRVPPDHWRPLPQRVDKKLQAGLDQALKKDKFRRSLLAEGNLAVGVVDLADPQAPRFAQVNGATMVYGASLPKLAILLAAYQGFADHTLSGTPEVRSDLIEMIRRSDNAASSRMVARLGLKKIEDLIQDPRYRFYDVKRGGGLWLGGSYSANGEQNPEPLKNLLYAASVNQVCRFYYLLAYGRLVDPESSRQMLKILAFPDLHDKFVTILEKDVPPHRLFRKSGQFRDAYSDSILVWSDADPWRRYILVAMVEHPKGEEILRGLVPVVEGLLKTSPGPRAGKSR